MPLCPVCSKEFKNVEKHIQRMSEKEDQEHKNYIPKSNEEQLNNNSTKIYKPGDIVSFKGKGRFEVVEDLGTKITVRREGNNLIKLTVKKERI